MNCLLPLIDALPDRGWITGDLRRMAAALPYFPAVGFEVKLGVAAPPDFAVQVPLRAGGAHIWYADVFNQCITPGTALSRAVKNIFLEFDYPYEAVPAIFLGLSDDAFGDANEVQAAAALLVTGARVDDDLAAHVTHLAAMPSRSADLLRINVAGKGIDAIPEAVEIRQSLDGYVYNLVCTLDLFSGRNPRERGSAFGLECYTDDWPRLLEHCSGRGLCSEADVFRLLGWKGESAGPPAESLPGWSVRTGAFLQGESCILRTLNHVKFVYSRERGLRMKAYLGALHRWS